MSDKKKCWVHYEAFEYGDEPPSDSHVEVPDTDALQARLATAEREGDELRNLLAKERASRQQAEADRKHYLDRADKAESKLAHLERLVEGLPVLTDKAIEEMEWTLVGDVSVDEDAEHEWTPPEADAIAALLTHRRGMKP